MSNMKHTQEQVHPYNDHTPLPWRSAYFGFFQEEGNGPVILEFANKGGTLANCEANMPFVLHACNTYYSTRAEIATLKAQRDELLEALKELMHAAIHCDPFFENRWASAYSKARTAIQNATKP